MGAYRCLIGFVCLGLATGCAEGAGNEIDASDLNLEYETASGPDLPPPPAGATCVLIQRGTLGQVADTDISFGNGPDWPMGAYPYTWTGPSPYSHWSVYRFDLSVIPADAGIVLGVFSNYGMWSQQSSTVRAHTVTDAWDEGTETWSMFTQNGAVTGWDPGVIGSFDASGVGYHSLDITGLVQSWHSGAAPNHGILLEEDPVHQHTYVASEASDVEQRPSLYVCYGDAVPDPVPECSNGGGSCVTSADCCEGLMCTGGVCGLPILPPSEDVVCAADNAPCGGAPCCNPDAVCDGVCIPPPAVDIGGSGGGGEACFPVGATCGDDVVCCSGQCQDGVCTSAGVCVQPDETDADGNPVACSANSPCCEGSHCVIGLCFPEDALWGGTCQLPGEACDPDGLGQWCCWDHACVDGTCQ